LQVTISFGSCGQGNIDANLTLTLGNRSEPIGSAPTLFLPLRLCVRLSAGRELRLAGQISAAVTEWCFLVRRRACSEGDEQARD
jgi:hypothetical protein